MARHLDLLQQYAGTNGHCHLWAYALKELLPEGEIVSLMARDRRTFEAHDWPESEPLELHRLLRLPDQTLVDAQGAHNLDEMLDKFGIREGYRFGLTPLEGEGHSLPELERDRPDWAQAVSVRKEALAALGWSNGIPAYDGELEKNWKSVSRMARNGIPEPSAEAASALQRSL